MGRLPFPWISWTNADDRLPGVALGGVKGSDGVSKGRDLADVCPQPPVPHQLDDLTQVSAVGFNNEIHRLTVCGPSLGRSDNGYQCTPCSYQGCGPPLDVASDDVKDQIDTADVSQRVILEVDEFICPEVERFLTVGGASCADDIGSGLPCELSHHRTDRAGRAMREDALPGLKASVLKQSLPCGEARDR